MGFAKTLIDTNGPLPVKGGTGFNKTSDYVFFISGSVLSKGAGEVGIIFKLDDSVTAYVQGYATKKDEYVTLVSQYIVVNLPKAFHTVELEVMNGNTTGHKNCWYRVLTMEV